MKRKLMHSSWTNDRKPLQCGSCAIPAVPYCGWSPGMNPLWMPNHLYLRARDPTHCRQFPLKPNILCFQNCLLWFITSFCTPDLQNGIPNPWTNSTNYMKHLQILYTQRHLMISPSDPTRWQCQLALQCHPKPQWRSQGAIFGPQLWPQPKLMAWRISYIEIFWDIHRWYEMRYNYSPLCIVYCFCLTCRVEYSDFNSTNRLNRSCYRTYNGQL